MKTAAFAIALLLGGAAFAQTQTDSTAYDGDGVATAAWETDGGAATAAYAAGSETVLAANDAAAGAPVVQPSNANPERDARGIAVISDPAIVPAGWNGTAAGAAMGGPELDAVTGEPVAPDSYPACTATVTDNCLQTYERQARP
jgi:hypothetical protein